MKTLEWHYPKIQFLIIRNILRNIVKEWEYSPLENSGIQNILSWNITLLPPTLFKCYFWRVCSKQPCCFASYTASFYPRHAVVASHYQSLQIVVLLLQACLFGSLALSRKLLLQQLQWLQQDRRFRLYTRVSSAFFENRQCCKLLEEKVEMFSQFRSRWKDGLATFLYSNFCGLGSNFHCSYWPFIKVMYANRVSAFSIQMVVKLSLCLLDIDYFMESTVFTHEFSDTKTTSA